MSLSKKQKAVLHVAKGKLGLDEETYRDVLEAYGGVRSSTGLDYEGFLAVMRHFEACGFKSREQGAGSREKGTRPGMASDGQIRKIKAMWLTLAGTYYAQGKEWKALRGFLKKRFRVDHENFLTPGKAGQVIEAIKAIGTRKHPPAPRLPSSAVALLRRMDRRAGEKTKKEG